MTAPVLVAYASRYGSTREVAEEVAATLRTRGVEADARPMREVHTLEGHGEVVLGAPFYMGSWPGDVGRFLSGHREDLTHRPVAIFSLGPLSNDQKEIAESRGQFDKELKKYPWLTPVALEMFAGKYDPSKLTFAHKLIAILPVSPLRGMPVCDTRDWTAIRAWATDLARSFGPLRLSSSS